jgi:hypothetical protein
MARSWVLKPNPMILTFGSLFKDHPEQLTILAVSCAEMQFTKRNRRVIIRCFLIILGLFLNVQKKIF